MAILFNERYPEIVVSDCKRNETDLELLMSSPSAETFLDKPPFWRISEYRHINSHSAASFHFTAQEFLELQET